MQSGAYKRLVRTLSRGGSAVKYVRYSYQGTVSSGVVADGQIEEIAGSMYRCAEKTGKVLGLNEVELLSPCEPSKVIVIGLNYAGHVAEARREIPTDPIIILKAQTSVIANNQPIVIWNPDHVVHFEGELAVVIGKQCWNVSRQDALQYVFGYTCGNDVSDRTLQRRDGQWVRAKSFDTFGPLGPWIETEIADPASLNLKTHVNGQLKQSASVSDMIFDIPALVEAVSKVMTLLPGDVILTGTPAGVGPLVPGDVVEVTIDGIGTLSNPVVARP